MVTEKIVVKAETSKGENYTLFEIRKPEVKVKRLKRKRNPEKEILFDIHNIFNEHVKFVWYRKNDFINVFVDLGAHDSRMVLNVESVKQLVYALKEWLKKVGKNVG